MNCQDFDQNFESYVIRLARNQLTGVDLREQGLAHARVCLRCGERLAEEQTLMAGVRAVIAEISAAEAPAHVESALLVTFRAQARQRNAPAVRPAPVQKRIRQWKSGVAYAAATLAIILIGLMWFKSNSVTLPERSAVSKQTKETSMLKGKDDVADLEPSLVSSPLVLEDVQQLKKRHPVRQAVAREEDDDEAATQFYSLVEEGELAPLESGRVVRVEVIASTLIPFGLQLTAETLTQPVQADLLLGQDGLARAIRFLPASQNIKTQ